MPALPEGTLVNTPKGKGKIIYARMAGPDYREPAAYSVDLNYVLGDMKMRIQKNPNYVGTMFPASDVTAVDVPSIDKPAQT